jgi:hypothetical protein
MKARRVTAGPRHALEQYPKMHSHRTATAARRGPTTWLDASVILGAVAALLSFIHIRDVAMLGGAGRTSWLYPLIVDTITVAAFATLTRRQDAGERTGVPWTLMIMGIAASLTANVVDSIMHAPLGATTPRLVLCIAVGTWPAVAWLGAMLLRHGSRPAAQPTAPTSAAEPPTIEPAARAAATDTPRLTADRPPAPIVQGTDRPATDRRPIPVRPTGQPDAWQHLGPRAASTGELRVDAWVQIGHPVYRQVKTETGKRPTETALQQALTDHVRTLIGHGALPPAVGQPSLSTVKRIRSAIETAHPELKAIAQPRRMTAITA